MKITPIQPKYLNAEEAREANPELFAQAEANRKATQEAKVKREEERAIADAKANGATVSLSDKSLSSISDIYNDDARMRRNIQWGIVRGLFLYSLFMIPAACLLALVLLLGH